MYYKLVDRVPVPCELMEWAQHELAIKVLNGEVEVE